MSFSVSIALCTYNGEQFLKEQLDSILGQSRLPNELVVCDDGSSDSTLEILKQFKKICPFPVYINSNEHNLGSTKNFERCISLCKGDIIFLCDQDDSWNPNKIELVEKEFIFDSEVKIVFTNATIVNEELKTLGYTAWEFFGLGELGFAKIRRNPFEYLFYGNKITGATMAFLKDAVPVHNYPESWVHDAWISILIAYLYPNGIHFVNQELILYRQHSGNQIGALKTMRQPAQGILMNKKSQLDEHLAYFYHLKKEIGRLPLHNAKNKQLVDNRIEHLENRNRLSSNIFRNITIITKELFTLRYFYFSNGVFSAIKDLFITR